MATEKIVSPGVRYAQALRGLPISKREELKSIGELEFPDYVQILAASLVIGKELTELKEKVFRGDGPDVMRRIENRAAEEPRA